MKGREAIVNCTPNVKSILDANDGIIRTKEAVQTGITKSMFTSSCEELETILKHLTIINFSSDSD